MHFSLKFCFINKFIVTKVERCWKKFSLIIFFKILEILEIL